MLVSSIKQITSEHLAMIRDKFPFVKIWDSHLYANEAFISICEK